MGIAVFQAVISSGLESRFPHLEGFGTQFEIPRDLNGYHRLHDLPRGPMRDAALTAFSHALRVCSHQGSRSFRELTFDILSSDVLHHLDAHVRRLLDRKCLMTGLCACHRL
jgi:hypothetical protein